MSIKCDVSLYDKLGNVHVILQYQLHIHTIFSEGENVNDLKSELELVAY